MNLQVVFFLLILTQQCTRTYNTAVVARIKSLPQKANVFSNVIHPPHVGDAQECQYCISIPKGLNIQQLIKNARRVTRSTLREENV